MSKISLYIEGGGDSKEQHIRCRAGFHKLLEKAGFSGRMPRIIPGGGRDATFDRFYTACRVSNEGETPMLLVDSEDTLVRENISAWQHLKNREESWVRPQGSLDDQFQMMVTCMETWIMADHSALSSFFGSDLNQNPLLSVLELEKRDRHAVQDALMLATRNCKKKYKKGERSFDVLAALNPGTLRLYLPHFVKFIDTLNIICQR